MSIVKKKSFYGIVVINNGLPLLNASEENGIP